MTDARRRIALFLLCAVVLLSAGFAVGYIHAFNGFNSPEAQIDHEMLEMDFNSRQLFYANQARYPDCQRELIRQLQGQIVFVNKLLELSPEVKNRGTALASVQQAQRVINGEPIISVMR